MLETYISARMPRLATVHKFSGCNKYADQRLFIIFLRCPWRDSNPRDSRLIAGESLENLGNSRLFS